MMMMMMTMMMMMMIIIIIIIECILLSYTIENSKPLLSFEKQEYSKKPDEVQCS
jgi:hypothetical protein